MIIISSAEPTQARLACMGHNIIKHVCLDLKRVM